MVPERPARLDEESITYGAPFWRGHKKTPGTAVRHIRGWAVSRQFGLSMMTRAGGGSAGGTHQPTNSSAVVPKYRCVRLLGRVSARGRTAPERALRIPVMRFPDALPHHMRARCSSTANSCRARAEASWILVGSISARRSNPWRILWYSPFVLVGRVACSSARATSRFRISSIFQHRGNDLMRKPCL